MDLKKMIESNLNIPAIELSDPVKCPCATYYLVSEEPGLIGNSREQEATAQYNIDIWERKREKVVQYAKTLKEVIKQISGSTIPTIDYSFDMNGKCWRGIIRFYQIEEGK